MVCVCVCVACLTHQLAASALFIAVVKNSAAVYDEDEACDAKSFTCFVWCMLFLNKCALFSG